MTLYWRTKTYKVMSNNTRKRNSGTNLASGIAASIETIVIPKRKTNRAEAVGRAGGEVCCLDKERGRCAVGVGGVKWERNATKVALVKGKLRALELGTY